MVGIKTWSMQEPFESVSGRPEVRGTVGHLLETPTSELFGYSRSQNTGGLITNSQRNILPQCCEGDLAYQLEWDTQLLGSLEPGSFDTPVWSRIAHTAPLTRGKVVQNTVTETLTRAHDSLTQPTDTDLIATASTSPDSLAGFLSSTWNFTSCDNPLEFSPGYPNLDALLGVKASDLNIAEHFANLDTHDSS